MHYYVMGAVEKEFGHSACNIKAEQAAKNKEVFEDLPRNIVRNLCARFWKLRAAFLSKFSPSIYNLLNVLLTFQNTFLFD